MLNGLFYMALKDIGTEAFHPNLGQIQFPRHKSEAAGGLVVLAEDQLGSDRAPTASTSTTSSPRRPPTLPSCRARWPGRTSLDGRPLGHLDTVTEKQLYGEGRCLLESVSAERLARFVQLFNTFGDRFGLFSGGMAISLDEARKRQIQEKTVDFFVGQKSRKEGTRVIEPVFIVEAKLLMDLTKSAR